MTQSELQALFDKFLSDNNGKKIERVDPNAYAQCFDLAIYWCEYLGFPKTIFSGLYGAHEIYDSWSNPQFQKIPNTPDYIPLKGDIVVWSGALNGGIGHVSVATGKGDTNSFDSFDQNWVVGSPSVIVHHNYNYVLGAQRYKITSSQPPMDDEAQARLQSKVNTDKYLVYLKQAGRITNDDSRFWLLDKNDPEKFLGLLKAIWSEREDYRKKAEAVPNTTAAKEEGRQLGLKQAKDAVNKLS